MSDYLNSLNPAQKEAVTTTEGPLLVIAGAGSGKTRVLTMRVAHLLEMGVKPWNILALTFTNKAAREMRERIAKIVGPETASQLWMGTFHSLFYRILRTESDSIGFNHDFTIYDTPDSKQLIRNIVKDLNLDSKAYTENSVLTAISTAKNDLISPKDYPETQYYIERDKREGRSKISAIYSEYCTRCKRANAMDFDDLLLYTNILFSNNPDILAKYQKHFTYTLVDEYQDTNHSQYAIIRQLVAGNRNICVVGDDSQSIYSFRGARIENILRFDKDYPEAVKIKLEQNYRSTSTIVNAANRIISNNINRLPKKLFSELGEGEKIKIIETPNDKELSARIASEIKSRVNSKEANNIDFAILYRNHTQSRLLEETLRNLRIPYKIYGGTSFYQREVIKDILAYCHVAIYPREELSLMRIINKPRRGIGDTTIKSIRDYSKRNNLFVWDTICSENHLAQCNLSQGTIKKVLSFANTIWDFYQQSTKINAFELIGAILDKSGIITELNNSAKDEETKDKIDNISELLSGIKQFVEQRNNDNSSATLSEYLQEISLMTSEDVADKDKNVSDYVTLMTIHASKGLEFDHVFIAGAEDEKIPGNQSSYNSANLEEERRLLYVAVTRARKTLSILYSKELFIHGQFVFGNRSRFLSELINDNEGRMYVEIHGSGNHKSFSNPMSRPDRYKKEPAQSRFSFTQQNRRLQPATSSANLSSLSNTNSHPTPKGFDSNLSSYSIGDNVIHDTFGPGVVTDIICGDSTKIKVSFKNAGEKTLLLKFARLRKID